MNRIIKFRGKRVDNGEWVYGSFVKHRKGGATIFCDNGSGFWVKDDTVCQFTGLTDKNGKDIYEGDILSYGTYSGTGLLVGKPCNHIVFFDEERATYRSKPILEDVVFSFVDSCAEIIGNIHDNQELLNDKK